MADYCITLICPRAIEERVLDAVLAAGEIAVIASSSCLLHGMHPARLDAAEQVLGGARSARIDALVPEAERGRLMEALRSQFRGAGLLYWCSPVTEAGEIL